MACADAPQGPDPALLPGILARGSAASTHAAEPATLNGLPGFVFHSEEGTETLAFEVAQDAIVAIYAVRNPDKLRHLS